MHLKHLLSLLLLLPTFAIAQKNWTKVDQASASVPSHLTTYQQIANHLTKNLTDESEKARAIYYWMAHAIRYDMKLAKSFERYNSSEELIQVVMKKRKGVCQHYAELYVAMCKSVGLTSYLVKGYTRYSDGSISNVSHAWNAIQLGNEFYLIDVTWAAGYQTKRKYVHKFRDEFFMIRPEVFVKTHMPFDPIWQFLPNPLNHTEFMNQNFAKLNSSGNFPFRQLIKEYEKLSKFDQYKITNERINASGVKNKLIKSMLDENQTQLTLILYNQSVDMLNEGVNQYNKYIGHKNKQFKNPDLSDDDILLMIKKADQGISGASKILQNLTSDNPELIKAIRKVRKQIPALEKSISAERAFVDKYISSSTLKRKALFFR